ncbi:chemotaxis protein [Clostridium aestuarii]|uniref:Stage 0 sporulation protein A homolog n=1 Tax=Clostridium aestuarii TaxID=338193 RepID=A0ABT4D0G0_9CLOT|nr:chemotaxis protein [Clostridium aestuarii]MCY6484728.1 chemotaxis protein [Clostridium aestuarii]
MNNKGILLESGTGELEVLEFVVNEKHYAINVIKTKEIVKVDNITKLPNSKPAVSGVSLLRGEVITVIDLKYILEKEIQDDAKKSMTIICEFNKTTVAFLVDKVVGIHRIGWSEIKKPDSIVENSLVIGNILMGNKMLMLLDFEKMIMDISSSYGNYEKNIEKVKYDVDRSDVRLVLADDSTMIRKILKDVLIKAGYNNLTFFDDGQQAYGYLMDLVNKKGEGFLEDVQMLITDIEMPQMDGHTLTRKVKENDILKKLPVVIFSSLITDDLHHKGISVGADAQISKPDIDNLVNLIDELCIN